ncbi:MAG: zinc-binding dehydrogenase [Dehalococcoidia bacterium]|nr:zinc-binding dehydrogenase [Dehalococcoidia bacterium]
MKAIRMTRTGGPEVLEYVDVPDPVPGAGELLIDVVSIGINFIDTYVRRGMYPRPLPLIPGYEVAGTVTEIGADVDEISVGDRVAMAGLSMGSYAEKMVIPEWQAVKVPDAVSMEDAAAVLEQGMTAHYLCYSTYPLDPENTALIHAGAGGVGRLLIQMAKQLGATVITTVSTKEKADMARSVGADHVVLYTEQEYSVLQLTRHPRSGWRGSTRRCCSRRWLPRPAAAPAPPFALSHSGRPACRRAGAPTRRCALPAPASPPRPSPWPGSRPASAGASPAAR